MKRGKPFRAIEHAVVPRICPGGTVVCIAGGPSLTAEDVEYCRGKAKVIAINDAYKLAPWADVLYACDKRWWDWHRGVTSFTGLKYALQRPALKWPGVQVLQNTGIHGLELKPNGVRNGKNSGYQAINVAVHLGAKRIVLLGYDMQIKLGGPSHWFGDHPLGGQPPVGSFRGMFAGLVKPLGELGIEVINCSRETALECFPVKALEQVL